MKIALLSAAAALAVAACSDQSPDEAPPTDDASEAVAAGPYVPTLEELVGSWEALGEDGKVIAFGRIYNDGSYARTVDGEDAIGTWKPEDGKICFDPDGDEADACYVMSREGGDGTRTLTADDGTVTSIRKTG